MMTHSFLSTWQRMLASRGSDSKPGADKNAAIHRYDPIVDSAAWAHCLDRARFHLGRARRAKDQGKYSEGAREIERALSYDDTSEAYFQVLGQCHLRKAKPDLLAARSALERAFSLNPRNGYTIKLLLQLHQADGNKPAARQLLVRALAAGASLEPWRRNLEAYRLEQPVKIAS